MQHVSMSVAAFADANIIRCLYAVLTTVHGPPQLRSSQIKHDGASCGNFIVSLLLHTVLSVSIKPVATDQCPRAVRICNSTDCNARLTVNSAMR